MENIRSIITGIVGLAVAGLFFVIMATVGLAVIGFAVVATAVGLGVAWMRGNLRVHKAQRHEGPRVWNDGRGTIIDM